MVRYLAQDQLLLALRYQQKIIKMVLLSLLKNVVDNFIKDGELPGGSWTLEEKQWR